MKHIILSTMLSLTTALLFSQHTVNMETLTVIQEKRLSNLPFSSKGQNTEVITSSEIKKLPVRTLAEALFFISGVDVRSRNTFAQSDISILGSSNDQILILIDGIPMRDPQTGHHQMNLPIDLSQVESIQVLKGSAARIFGAGAMAGAINIVTKSPGTEKVNVTSYWGTNFEKDSVTGDAYNLSVQKLSLGWHYKNTGNTIQLCRNNSNGYSFNTGVEQSNINYRGNWLSKNGQRKINWIFGQLNNSFGAKDFYASPYDATAIEMTKTNLLGINSEFNTQHWTFRPRVYFRYNQDEYILKKDDPNYYKNNHFSNTYGLEFHAIKKNKLGSMGCGVENRNDDIHSTNLGDHQRSYLSGYIEQRINFSESTILTGGINSQYNSDFGWHIYPDLDASHSFQNSTYYFHSGSSSRIPTYTDLYYVDIANQGNSQLNPENAWSSELGYRYNNRNLIMSLVLFQRKTENQIDYVKGYSLDNTNPNKWIPLNLGVGKFKGIESSCGYIFQEQSSWFQMTSAKLKINYLNATINTNSYESKYMLNYLNYQLIANINFKTGHHISHSILFRNFERYSGMNTTLIDIRSQWEISNWTMFIDASNILNEEYYLSGVVKMPGSWFNFGIQYLLK